MTLELRKTGAVEVRPPVRERARAYLVGRRMAAVAVSRRRAWTTWQVLRQVPGVLLSLVGWSPRGLARLTAAWARYLRDHDTAELGHHHAGTRETKEFKTAHDIRKERLTARWMINGSGVGIVLALAFAWTWPRGFGTVCAALIFVWVVKLIPGRSLGEVGIAFCLAVGVYFGAPYVADRYIPVPPWWAFWTAGTAAVLGLGWAGRPKAAPLVTMPTDGPLLPQKPTREMVIDALCRIGLPGMSMEAKAYERAHAETRIMAPGVATTTHGYVMEMELPPGITAEKVVALRGPLAGALRRDLGCVWPSGREDKHPCYLRIFFSHRPMNSGRQPSWPLMKTQPVDSFDALPLFTDEEMRWVCLTLAGTHTVVGGASGFGKSVWLRQLTCALAFDLRARLYLFDGKRSGDLDHVRKLAHAFHEGAEPEDIEAIIAELEGLVAECTRRAKFLKGLPPDERSPKVTSTLASKYRELAQIFAVFDEVQEYTEYGITKEEKKLRVVLVGLLTKLARVGRSAGIFLVLTSQKPDASVIPSAIMGNCAIRVAFKVSDQVHNDQILGTSARRNGIDATQFGARDRGLAWLKGGDAVDAQVVRSWSEMVDVGLAVELADKAYELRQAGGWLTGQAAGEDIEDAIVVDVVADALSIVDSPEHGGRNISLQMLGEKFHELRPTIWDRLDPDAVGALLRTKHVTVDSIWCPVEGRSMQGVKREWLVAGDDT